MTSGRAYEVSQSTSGFWEEPRCGEDRKRAINTLELEFALNLYVVIKTG